MHGAGHGAKLGTKCTTRNSTISYLYSITINFFMIKSKYYIFHHLFKDIINYNLTVSIRYQYRFPVYSKNIIIIPPGDAHAMAFHATL